MRIKIKEWIINDKYALRVIHPAVYRTNLQSGSLYHAIFNKLYSPFRIKMVQFTSEKKMTSRKFPDRVEMKSINNAKNYTRVGMISSVHKDSQLVSNIYYLIEQLSEHHRI